MILTRKARQRRRTSGRTSERRAEQRSAATRRPRVGICVRARTGVPDARANVAPVVRQRQLDRAAR